MIEAVRDLPRFAAPEDSSVRDIEGWILGMEADPGRFATELQIAKVAAQGVRNKFRADLLTRKQPTVGDHSRLCPACQCKLFAGWPSGWDAHAAHVCTGVAGNTPEARKQAYRQCFLLRSSNSPRKDVGSGAVQFPTVPGLEGAEEPDQARPHGHTGRRRRLPREKPTRKEEQVLARIIAFSKRHPELFPEGFSEGPRNLSDLKDQLNAAADDGDTVVYAAILQWLLAGFGVKPLADVFKFDLKTTGPGRPPSDKRFAALIEWLSGKNPSYGRVAQKVFAEEFARSRKRAADLARSQVNSAIADFMQFLQNEAVDSEEDFFRKGAAYLNSKLAEERQASQGRRKRD
jgi:hypothetical protein